MLRANSTVEPSPTGEFAVTEVVVSMNGLLRRSSKLSWTLKSQRPENLLLSDHRFTKPMQVAGSTFWQGV